MDNKTIIGFLIGGLLGGVVVLILDIPAIKSTAARNDEAIGTLLDLLHRSDDQLLRRIERLEEGRVCR